MVGGSKQLPATETNGVTATDTSSSSSSNNLMVTALQVPCSSSNNQQLTAVNEDCITRY